MGLLFYISLKGRNEKCLQRCLMTQVINQLQKASIDFWTKRNLRGLIKMISTFLQEELKKRYRYGQSIIIMVVEVLWVFRKNPVEI